MLKSVIDFITEIINPVANLIDEIHTSEEEKLKLKKAFLELNTKAAVEIAKYELEIKRMQAKVIEAKSVGGNWLQKSWRPITMLVFIN